MRCQKTKLDGNICRASALIGKKYCALHFEEGLAAKLGSIGGRRRAIFNPDELKRFSAPKTAAHVRDLLAQSMVELRDGVLDPRIASSMCCLAAEFLKTLELCTLEEVIEPLEREREERNANNGNTEISKTKN